MLENRYKIEEKIGEGGFATVFRAYDRQEKRQVAIKVLKPGILSDPSMVERLRREFKAGVKLDHPNIVKIYDLQITEKQAYVVLEFLAAEPLEEILSKTSIPVETALKYTLKMCSALEHMHKMGIFHRDIKPANIMVGPSGPVLMDFNLVFDAELTALTKTNQFVGTPSYMAPEAVYESNSNAQSDIYSLGLVLWQMLTGVEPYGGIKNINELVASWRADGLAAPSKLKEELPAFIDEIVKKATSVDVSTRYKSAKEFARAVKGRGKRARRGGSRSLSSSSVSVPVRDRSNGSYVQIALAFMLLIGCFVGGYILFKPLPELSVEQPEFIHGLEQIKLVLRTQKEHTGSLNFSNVSVAASEPNTKTHTFVLDKSKVRGVRKLQFKTMHTKPAAIDFPVIPETRFTNPQVVNNKDSTTIIFRSSLPLDWFIDTVPAGALKEQRRIAAKSVKIEVSPSARLGADDLQLNCCVTDKLGFSKKLPVVKLHSLSPAKLGELIKSANLENVINKWQKDRISAADKVSKAKGYLKFHSLLNDGELFLKYHSHLFKAIGKDKLTAEEFSKNLCLLNRVGAFFVSNESESSLRFKANCLTKFGFKAFMLDAHPWPWDSNWHYTILKKDVSDHNKSLVPIRKSGLTSTIGFMAVDKTPASNEYNFDVSRTWLRRCKGGRFLFYITLKQRAPEVGVEITINNGLTLPCWPFTKGDFETRNHFIFDLNAGVLKPGRNTFLVRAVAVAYAKLFGTTLVKEIALIPGGISIWKSKFKASFKEMD